VFDYNNKFVHLFDSEGSEDDQLSSPRGIAVSHNGSVYISDCDNNRILVH